jgi:hypothetical protein
MVQIIMDHGASWCFGTRLAPCTRSFHIAFSREAACPRNRLIIEYMANTPMVIPISKSAGGSGTA